MIPTREFDVTVKLQLLDGGRETLNATICAVENGLFQVSSPRPLQPNRLLDIVHPEARIESRIAYCKHNESGGYQLGVIVAEDLERRCDQRIPADLPATLRTGGALTCMPARIKDVSTSGLGLEVPSALSIGASVSVEWSDGTAHGEVRHCTRNLDQYRAGIRLHEFVLRESARHAVTLEFGSLSGPASLARSVQQRQSRYQAILFSLAPPPPPEQLATAAWSL